MIIEVQWKTLISNKKYNNKHENINKTITNRN